MRTLVDYRPALRSRTGVGEYVHELARALVRTQTTAGELTIFSSSWSDRLAQDAVPGAQTLDCRWPVRVLNYAWHTWGWPPVETLTGTSERPFDVVQSLHPLLMPARRAARLVTIHDLDFLDHPERTSAEIRRDYPGRAASHARAADRVIAVSEFTAGEVERRLNVPRDRISVCSPGAPAWLPRVSEPADGYILFFGTLEPRKNVGALLDAYGALASSRPSMPRLVLAGRPAEGSQPWLERVKAPPFAGRVDLKGYVAPEDRQALIAGALVLVMPSFMEGFGIPALEAMTLGVPVVVSNRGSLPEVVGDAGLIFDPDHTEALIDALRRVIDEAALRNGMSERGRQRAKAYSWDRTAVTTRDAWQQAIEASKAAARV